VPDPYASHVAIRVTRNGDKFDVEVTRPEGEWQSTAPLTAHEVMTQLSSIGCHQTAAMDALTESGADWVPGYDAEVLRRRQQGA
jgi:hypothetical protein